MPKYHKKLLNRKYKPVNERQIAIFLTALNDDQFQEFQNVVQTMKHDHKLKPSAKNYIAENNAHDITRKMFAQRFAHNQEWSNYHSGGDLHDTLNTAASVIWAILSNNLLKPIFGDRLRMGQKKETDFEKGLAEIIEQTYQNQRETQTDQMWRRLNQYDTERCTVWKHDDDVYVAIRGMKITNLKDILGAANVINENRAEFQEVTDTLKKVQNDFPQANLFTASHSLGTVLVRDAIEHNQELNRSLKTLTQTCNHQSR